MRPTVDTVLWSNLFDQ